MSESKKNQKISVTVIYPKSNTEKKKVETEKNATVKEFKAVIAKHFNAQPSQLKLIFGGKILNDQDTLATYGIKDGSSVHLIIQTDNPQTTTSSTSTGSFQSHWPDDDIYTDDSPYDVDIVWHGFPGMDLMGSENLVNPMGDLEILDMLHNTQERARQALVESFSQLRDPQNREESRERNQNTFATQSENNGEPNPQQRQENREPIRNWRSWLSPPGIRSNSSNERYTPMYHNVPSGRMAYTFNDPLRSMEQQMNENLHTIQSMRLNSPYSQSTLPAMTSNLNLANNSPSYNPLLANNPGLRSQSQVPIQLMSNSAVHDTSSYRNVNAPFQVPPGFEAPLTNMPNIGSQHYYPTRNAYSTTTAPNNIPATESHYDNYVDLMRRMRSRSRYAFPYDYPFEESYVFLLERLYTLGFSNLEANIHALVATSRNFNAAVEWLFEHEHLFILRQLPRM